MKLKHKQTLAALLASVSLSAMADVGDPATTCDAMSSALPSSAFLDCSGPQLGDPQASGVLDFTGVFGNSGSFDFVGKNVVGAPGGPFAAISSITGGTLDLLAAQFGSFVIGLQTADSSGAPENFAYYLYDRNPAGVASIDFNTSGVAIDGNFSPRPLIAATLYANPVPEPETYALMLAGLGVLGFAGRRRAS